MTTILDLKNRLSKVDVSHESQEAIDATKGDMIARQKDQLSKGLRPDGSKIGKYKSSAYAKRKNQLNPAPGFGFMDFKLTGELYSQIFVDVRDNTFVIDSADEKTGPLIQRLGDPFGLNKDNQGAYVENTLEPQFLNQIKKITGL